MIPAYLERTSKDQMIPISMIFFLFSYLYFLLFCGEHVLLTKLK